MDLQAMARVHRIGQEKTVHVSQASSHDDGLYQIPHTTRFCFRLCIDRCID